MMIDGDKYYTNEPEDTQMPHAFMYNLVDEKIQYLLGKEPTMGSNVDNSKYLEEVGNALGDNFLYALNLLGTEASNKGIAFEQVYFEDNMFKKMLIPSEEFIPIWTDNTHTKLKWGVRMYDIEIYEGSKPKTIQKAEIYTDEYTYYYVYENGKLQLDSEKYLDMKDGQEFGHFTIDNEQYSIGRVPYIWCKNNHKELPDLKFVKDLIDAYSNNRSRTDALLEDFKNFLVVIRNYAENPDNALSLDKMLELRRFWVDADGGVDILTPTIDTTANESHNSTLKDDIILFGRSVDRNKMVGGNAPSGIALKTLYSGLDLKCNKLESEVKNYFEQLLHFVDIYLQLVIKYTKQEGEKLSLTLNRDITMNESDVIKDCQNSKGVTSDRTILKNHPWVTDVDEEMEQIEKEAPTVDNYPGLPHDPEEGE